MASLLLDQYRGSTGARDGPSESARWFARARRNTAIQAHQIFFMSLASTFFIAYPPDDHCKNCPAVVIAFGAMDILTFLLALAASARLTRLIVTDSITLPLRERLANHIVNRSQEGRAIRGALWFQDLTNCEWCTGVWVAAAITPIAWAGNGHTWFLLPASVLTVSYLIGVAAVVLGAIEEM